MITLYHPCTSSTKSDYADSFKRLCSRRPGSGATKPDERMAVRERAAKEPLGNYNSAETRRKGFIVFQLPLVTYDLWFYVECASPGRPFNYCRWGLSEAPPPPMIRGRINQKKYAHRCAHCIGLAWLKRLFTMAACQASIRQRRLCSSAAIYLR